MKDEILKRVDALAATLGVATKELWRILVQQARVEAYMAIGYTLVGAIGVAIATKVFFNGIKAGNEDGWNDFPVGASFGALGLFVFTIVFFVNLYGVWTPLFNPEFYALHQILSTIKGADCGK